MSTPQIDWRYVAASSAEPRDVTHAAGLAAAKPRWWRAARNQGGRQPHPRSTRPPSGPLRTAEIRPSRSTFISINAPRGSFVAEKARCSSPLGTTSAAGFQAVSLNWDDEGLFAPQLPTSSHRKTRATNILTFLPQSKGSAADPKSACPFWHPSTPDRRTSTFHAPDLTENAST